MAEETRLSRCVHAGKHLAQELNHSDQIAALKGYCTGLVLPLSRKSVDASSSIAAYGFLMARAKQSEPPMQ